MLLFDLYIILSECNAWEMLGGLMTVPVVCLLRTTGIWSMKASESTSASLRASLVDLESLRSS